MARKSIMTTRVYRVSPTGQRIELSSDEVRQGEPYQRPITDMWPDCECRRCIAQWAEGDERVASTA